MNSVKNVPAVVEAVEECEKCNTEYTEASGEVRHVERFGNMCLDCIEEGHAKLCEDCDEYYDIHSVEHVIGIGEVCDDCTEGNSEYLFALNSYGDSVMTHESEVIILITDGWDHECTEYYVISDADFFTCEDCEKNFTNDCDGDDPHEYICKECYSVRKTGEDYVRGYDDNPAIEFFGQPDNDRYFGVELEIDNGDINEFAEDYNEHIEPRIFLKEDSSLDDGVEIVTQPLSLSQHLNTDLWTDATSYASTYDFESHDTTTCGLHVHVSRGSLSNESEAIYNIEYLVERFWNRIVKFSRRRRGALHEWAARKVGNIEPDKITKKDVKDARRSTRYSAINVTSHTVEFRMFRGSLRVETIKASIELVEMFCSISEEYAACDLDIESLTWSEIAEYAKDSTSYLYKELKRMELLK